MKSLWAQSCAIHSADLVLETNVTVCFYKIFHVKNTL